MAALLVNSQLHTPADHQIAIFRDRLSDVDRRGPAYLDCCGPEPGRNG
jgi:hypothetical protein